MSANTPNREELLKVVERARSDFEYFCTALLGEEPWSLQVEIATALQTHKRVAVKSCNGAGKTWLAARLVLWGLQTHYNAIVVTTAPSARQVETLLWKEINIAWKKLTRRHPGLFGGRLYEIPKLQITKEWMAYGFSTVDPNNFQGIHAPYVLITFDEAGGVKAPLWEPLDGNLVGDDCHFLAIGNPTDPSMPFFRECQDVHTCTPDLPCDDEPGTKVFTISAFDTPNFTTFGITEDDIVNGSWKEKLTGPLPQPQLTTPAAVAGFLRKHGRNSTFWAARVLGLFPEQGTDTLLWMSWVQDARDRWEHEEADSPFTAIDVGCDIAAGGDNETVITAVASRLPGDIKKQLLLRPSDLADTTETRDLILAACLELHVAHPDAVMTVRIDADGVGKGVYDMVREHVERHRWDWLTVVGMRSGLASDDPEEYLNRRSQYWWAVREYFEGNRLAILEDDTQTSQLTSIKWRESTARRVIQIEPKEEAEKRGVASPDRADALMFALAPVSIDSGSISVPLTGGHTRGYQSGFAKRLAKRR